jgi:hypothetical protein
MTVELDVEIIVPSQWDKQSPLHRDEETRDDADDRSEGFRMADPNPSLLTLLATLDDGAGPRY